MFITHNRAYTGIFSRLSYNSVAEWLEKNIDNEKINAIISLHDGQCHSIGPIARENELVQRASRIQHLTGA